VIRAAFWATTIFAATGNGEDAWPGFQGPPAEGLRAETLPLTWTPTENVAWIARVPGYGQSSPVIWNERLFVTSISGPMKDMCHVCAFDLRTGTKLWQHDLAAATKVENSGYLRQQGRADSRGRRPAAGGAVRGRQSGGIRT
jgi:outer membrane protein assembly factor BamB